MEKKTVQRQLRRNYMQFENHIKESLPIAIVNWWRNLGLLMKSYKLFKAWKFDDYFNNDESKGTRDWDRRDPLRNVIFVYIIVLFNITEPNCCLPSFYSTTHSKLNYPPHCWEHNKVKRQMFKFVLKLYEMEQNLLFPNWGQVPQFVVTNWGQICSLTIRKGKKMTLFLNDFIGRVNMNISQSFEGQI